MPTTLIGIVLYVFSLAPGVAFTFAREGHHPSTKRSAIRETASIVFVSTICNAVVLVAAAALAATIPMADRILRQMLSGDFSWALDNYVLAALVALALLAIATLVGLVLGGQRADRWLLGRLWKSAIPRDQSAWSATLYAPEKLVVIASVTLKSGAWLSGAVYSFEADPNPNPERTLILSGELQMRAAGSDETVALDDTAYLVVEAAQIEVLQVNYMEPDVETPEARGVRAWAARRLHAIAELLQKAAEALVPASAFGHAIVDADPGAENDAVNISPIGKAR